jgi:hypothetical protein
MFKNLREAHDTPTESLRDRNDEILERIYIDRRFKNDTVRVALRSKTSRKTLRAVQVQNAKIRLNPLVQKIPC